MLEQSLVVVLTIGAYLVGSLSFAVIVSRVMGLDDPRTYGSQNPGATNVLRSGNKAAAIATLLFDALKGYFPVLLVKLYGPAFGLNDQAVALVAISAFIGHLWPVFFAFKGGKGVATAAGVLFGVEPLLGLATMGTWVIVAFFFRYSSLAALAASLFIRLRQSASRSTVGENSSSRMPMAASMAISTCWMAALTMTSCDFSRRNNPIPPVSTNV